MSFRLRPLAAFCLLLAAPVPHRRWRSEQLPPAVAAVIDYQRVLREAKAAQSIRDQVETRRKLYQDEIAKEEQRLHEADKELAQQRGVLCRRRLRATREEFEKKVAGVQRMVQERRRTAGPGHGRGAQRGALRDDRDRGRALRRAGLQPRHADAAVLLFSPKIDLTVEVIRPGSTASCRT